ncbi:hypothetical protein [Microbacterium gorillae]|uniref:hypothetical protein n=1 Tax=Microbacterium gorillae TaxID=1231063 RepID=UPI003D97C5DA
MAISIFPVDASKFDQVMVLGHSEVVYDNEVQKDEDGNTLFNVQVALTSRDQFGRVNGEVIQVRQTGRKDKPPVDFVGPAQFPNGLTVSIRVNDKGYLNQYWNADLIAPATPKIAQPGPQNG